MDVITNGGFNSFYFFRYNLPQISQYHKKIYIHKMNRKLWFWKKRQFPVVDIYKKSYSLCYDTIIEIINASYLSVWILLRLSVNLCKLHWRQRRWTSPEIGGGLWPVCVCVCTYYGSHTHTHTLRWSQESSMLIADAHTAFTPAARMASTLTNWI